MSDSIESLRRKLGSARDLQSVVRTMKALATGSIGQYEKSVLALTDYFHTVELGLGACLREIPFDGTMPTTKKQTDSPKIEAIVFGSDQGLVGQFNDIIANHAIEKLSTLPGKPTVWVVGERVHAQLSVAGFAPLGLFPVPIAVQAITPLVGRIQIESEAHRTVEEYSEL